MKNTFLSTIKVAAITFLLSAAACNENTPSEVPGETSTTLSDTLDSQLTPATSTVMNAEGTGTVESRQIQGTDGAGGAPGSDAVMSASAPASASANGSTPTPAGAAKK
ncbi:hypothetical protein CNR22_18805 [Sphingobacteriaceae bacterium]|nr:hypothetical protein CNR22_18805 [Sphingobacteriaceae bacterium]